MKILRKEERHDVYRYLIVELSSADEANDLSEEVVQVLMPPPDGGFVLIHHAVGIPTQTLHNITCTIEAKYVRSVMTTTQE